RLQVDHDPQLGDKVLEALRAGSDQTVELRRNEFVGSQVGEELREQGGLGMLLALFMIMVYLAFRFQLKFSLGAVVALVHDVV
ncbi:protein translocase subunit SecF, partial [Klebsiella pneumoniae]|nr:protein translocase subunit SecF [Klebsiella pneumoniae]